MAIVDGQPETLDVHWHDLTDLPAELWMENDFYRNIVLSIRIVLNNAAVPALEGFRVRLVKVRFSEAKVVATELWRLKAWLNPQFMAKMESVEGKEWIEALLEMQGLDGVGLGTANFVRKYFDL